MRIPTRIAETFDDNRGRVDDGIRHDPFAFSAGVACLVTAVFMLSCFRVAAPPAETVVAGLVVGAASFLSLCVRLWLAGDLSRRSKPGLAARGVASAGAARARRPGGA